MFLSRAIRFFQVGFCGFCMKKYCSSLSLTFPCKICHNFTQLSELKMAGKRKRGGAWATRSGAMRFFHPSVTFLKKYGDAGFNWDWLSDVTITGEFRRVFICRSREASGYEFTHPDFPGTTFQVAKNNFLITEEGEVPFDSEVVQPPPPPPPPAQEASVATATTTKNISINQALRKSIANSNPSVNNNILATVLNSAEIQQVLMQVNCVLWALRLKMRTLCLRICQMLAQWIVKLRQWVIWSHQQFVLVSKRTVATQMENFHQWVGKLFQKQMSWNFL